MNRIYILLFPLFIGISVNRQGEKNGTYFQLFKVPYTLIYPDCGVSLHLPLNKDGAVFTSYKYVTEIMPG